MTDETRAQLIVALEDLRDQAVDCGEAIDLEYGRTPNEEGAARVREIVGSIVTIVRHPVPRCDACQWWQPIYGGGEEGYCSKFDGASGDVQWQALGAHGLLRTSPSFGCVQFTAKAKE